MTILHVVAVIIIAALLITGGGHDIVRCVAAVYLLANAWLEAYQS